MTFYEKFIKTARKGYSLRGGPHARWRYPLARVLYKKRQLVGPEPERPRSAWVNWNYKSELYAFGRRLNEMAVNESLLRRAFVHPSHSFSQMSQMQEIGIKFDGDDEQKNNNLELAASGEKICKAYLRAVLQFWYKQLPDDCIE